MEFFKSSWPKKAWAKGQNLPAQKFTTVSEGTAYEVLGDIERADCQPKIRNSSCEFLFH